LSPRPTAAVAVAVSGGRDSVALLHATARAAVVLGLEVHALHVHHGLVAAADDWLRQLQRQCRRWARAGLPVLFHAHRLDAAPAPGDSIEAWARRQRYRALAAMARDAGCGLVLLAHHRRDQAETLLLQALRGGGPAGLAAMPRCARRDGITWARPWLDQPREAIEAYVRRHRLTFVDDASNDDPRFARNRLRWAVWPALTRAFPDAEQQLHAASRRAHEAAACLDELARADLAAASADGALQVAPWLALSPARRTGLLRHWLRSADVPAAPDSLVQRLAAELPGKSVGRWPAPAGELVLYRGRLRLEGRPSPAAAAFGAQTLDLARLGRVELPGWGGALVVRAAVSGGVPAARLRAAVLRPRSGGERFQLVAGGLPRSLKKQYQARGLPESARAGPLVYDGPTLLFVPGLGIDARCLAPAGTEQLTLAWEPAGSGPSQPAV
jgi:tRNA(Ile)-lysidine synthase